MNNFYTVYGLTIKSDVLLPELICADSQDLKTVDCEIHYGLVDEEIKQTIARGKMAQYTPQKIWFHIKALATFIIVDGTQIIIDKCQDGKEERIRLYLLGTCLGFILFQKNRLVIHGGTVCINNKGMIFTGKSGAGKSTLTSALRLKGYGFVTDDLSVLVKNGYPEVESGYPQQKLCEDAMKNLGYNRDHYQQIGEGSRMKYLIPVKDQFVNQSVPLQGICEITLGQVEHVEIQYLRGSEKINALYQNIYNIDFKEYMGINPDYFKHCISVAQKIPIYRIIRPQDHVSIEEEIQLVEHLVNQLD